MRWGQVDTDEARAPSLTGLILLALFLALPLAAGQWALALELFGILGAFLGLLWIGRIVFRRSEARKREATERRRARRAR